MGRVGRFFDELKKRHVYRVAVAYAVIAWVLVQAASIIVPELHLPAATTRVLIIAAFVGFPIAVVLAWLYDVVPAPGSRREVPTVAIAATLLVAAGLAVYAFVGRHEPLPRGAALVERLNVLADSGRDADAFELAARAADAGEAVPDSVVGRFTDRLTLLTEPAGATVRVRRYIPATPDSAAAWLELGQTPLRGVPVTRGDYIAQFALPDYATVERIVSSSEARSLQRRPAIAEVQLEVALLRAESMPREMVHVPGGLYRVASRDLQSLSATLEDFFIDRTEVTNQAFAEFVDAGGYTRAEFWTDLIAETGRESTSQRQRFTDKTGMPGPRLWTGQRPSAELLNHPVTGVSWYEAAAYCRFRKARLPSLFEWEKAARDGRTARGQGIMMPWGYTAARDPATHRANFSGPGTTRVGAFPFGMSVYGALDMAGNVKEWLSNRSESGRAVTGGSWADPIYVFSEVGSIDAAAESPTIGFRCARGTSEQGGSGEADRPLRLAVRSPTYHPVDDATFRLLLAHYDYDPRPLEAVVEKRTELPAWTLERITYNGVGGDRVIAYLFLPRHGRGPFQTMVYVPSSAAFFASPVPILAEQELGPLIRGGRAVFTIVMKGMIERESPPDYQRPAPNSVAFRDEMVANATELRLGLDYLATRDDIDMNALVYVAASWGAGSRLVFAATDPRFKAAILIGAGIDERLQPTLPEASSINFAPHIPGPKLMVNGREDEEHPWRTRAQPLWNLLSEPKELKLFEGVGHWPPPELRIPAVRDFLDRHFPLTTR